MGKYMSDFIRCWGSNLSGQLDNAVRQGDSVRSVVSGADSTCVLLNGAIYGVDAGGDNNNNSGRDVIRCWGQVILKTGWIEFKRNVNQLGFGQGRARVAMGFQLVCAVDKSMNWCDDYNLNYD